MFRIEFGMAGDVLEFDKLRLADSWRNLIPNSCFQLASDAQSGRRNPASTHRSTKREFGS